MSIVNARPSIIVVPSLLRTDLRHIIYPKSHDKSLREIITATLGSVPANSKVVVNGETKDLDYIPQDGDNIAVFGQVHGVDPVSIFLQILISLAFSAISAALSKPPKSPVEHKNAEPSNVYSIGATNNQAKLGGVVPVIYGVVTTTPDYAAEPYVEYINNEQYFKALYCVGVGSHEIQDLYLGDTPVSSLPDDIVWYKTYTKHANNPNQTAHKAIFGTIERDTYNAKGLDWKSKQLDPQTILENVNTVAEVANQEIPTAGKIESKYDSDKDGNYYRLHDTPAGPGWLQFTGSQYDTLHYAFYHDMSTTVDIEMRKTGDATGTVSTVTLTGSGHTAASLPVPKGPGEYEVKVSWPTKIPGRLHINRLSMEVAQVQNVGPFYTSKADPIFGQCQGIYLDFEFPRGLYKVNATNGKHESLSVVLEVVIRNIDDTNTATREKVGQFEFVGSSATPQRFTRTVWWDKADNIATPGRFQVWVRRTSRLGDANDVGDCYWTGMKSRMVYNGHAYGDTTLIAVSIKATGISSIAQKQLKVRCVRHLPVDGFLLDSVQGPVPTALGAATAAENMLYATYGGNFSDPKAFAHIDELVDRQAFHDLRVRTADQPFNAIFDKQVPLYEAVSAALARVGATALPIGSKVSLASDGVKPHVVGMFNESNIVKGSLSVSYSFDNLTDYKGYRVEYRDPTSFQPAHVGVDIVAGAEDSAENVSLFGCTDKTQAQQHGELLAARKRKQRKTIEFETELEGLLVRYGDRITVAHSAPIGVGNEPWGQSATIVSYTDLGSNKYTAVLSHPITTVPGHAYRAYFRDHYGMPVTSEVTFGGNDYTINFTLAAPMDLDDVLVSIIPIDTTSRMNVNSDWIVTSVEPNGNTVKITGVTYDPTMYDKAFPHLRDVNYVATPAPVPPPPPKPEAPSAPGSGGSAGGDGSGSTGPGWGDPVVPTTRVPLSGEVTYVSGQFVWYAAGKVTTIHFGNGRSYEIWATGMSSWTSPEGIQFFRGTEVAGSGGTIYRVWAIWPNTGAGTPPALPGQPGYEPPPPEPPYDPGASGGGGY